MNWAKAFDMLGENGVNLLIGLVVGLVFGAFAQQSRFCLRSAALEFAHGSIGQKVAIWLLAFGAALTGTQLLALSNTVSLAEPASLHHRRACLGPSSAG